MNNALIDNLKRQQSQPWGDWMHHYKNKVFFWRQSFGHLLMSVESATGGCKMIHGFYSCPFL
jgi:hypothetical protein